MEVQVPAGTANTGGGGGGGGAETAARFKSRLQVEQVVAELLLLDININNIYVFTKI